MDFSKLVMQSRSYRNFDESCPIQKEILEELVDITRFTPSSVNLQPLKYHISYDKDEVENVLKLVKFAGLLPEYSFPEDGKHPTGFITIFLDTEISDNEGLFLKDVGIAAQTIMLSAAEKGFGGCIAGNFDGEAIKKLLGIRNSLKPELVLALGKPAEKVEMIDIIGNDTKYFRNEDGTIHYVPKRKFKDIVV